MEFRKVVLRNFQPSDAGGFDVHEAVDYIAVEDLAAYRANRRFYWAVIEDFPDDRPADADRSYAGLLLLPVPEGV